jgi:hypothetical protein
MTRKAKVQCWACGSDGKYRSHSTYPPARTEDRGRDPKAGKTCRMCRGRGSFVPKSV